MEADQIDILPLTVPGNLEQIDDTEETGLACQLWSDIGKTDGLDGINLDLAIFHAVAGAHFDVRTRPDSDTAGDFSATNAVAKAPGEYHEESLSRLEGRLQATLPAIVPAPHSGNVGGRNRVH
jgi:hypothetical protein